MSTQNTGGGWKKTINTKNGEVEIISLSLNGKRYTLWPNSFKKEGDRSPDFKVTEDTYEPKKESKEEVNDLPF